MTKMGTDCTGHGLGPNPGGQSGHMKVWGNKSQKPLPSLKMDYNHTKYTAPKGNLKGKRQ